MSGGKERISLQIFPGTRPGLTMMLIHSSLRNISWSQTPDDDNILEKTHTWSGLIEILAAAEAGYIRTISSSLLDMDTSPWHILYVTGPGKS